MGSENVDFLMLQACCSEKNLSEVKMMGVLCFGEQALERRSFEMNVTGLASISPDDRLEHGGEESILRGSTAQSPFALAETPLTSALLRVAAKGISFATPGHRCGRSYRFSLELKRRVD